MITIPNSQMAFISVYEERIDDFCRVHGVGAFIQNDWLLRRVPDDAPGEWMYAACPKIAHWLLQPYALLSGGYLQRNLAVRAWTIEHDPLAHAMCTCLVCEKQGRDWTKDTWYLFTDAQVKQARIDMELYIPETAPRVLDGELVPGVVYSHGCWVCDNCAAVVRAADPASLWLVSVLLDKADEAYMKEIAVIAMRDLPYTERRRIELAKQEKKQQRANVTAVSKWVEPQRTWRMVDGKLVEIER